MSKTRKPGHFWQLFTFAPGMRSIATDYWRCRRCRARWQDAKAPEPDTLVDYLGTDTLLTCEEVLAADIHNA